MKKIVQVYRSSRKEGAYIYVEKGYDVTLLPEELSKLLGKLEVALVLVLTPEKKLANADTESVLRAINENGYYLQMPPLPESYMRQVRNDKLSGVS